MKSFKRQLYDNILINVQKGHVPGPQLCKLCSTFLDALSAGTGHTYSSLALPSLQLLLLLLLACSTGEVLCISSGSSLFLVILILVVLH